MFLCSNCLSFFVLGKQLGPIAGPQQQQTLVCEINQKLLWSATKVGSHWYSQAYVILNFLKKLCFFYLFFILHNQNKFFVCPKLLILFHYQHFFLAAIRLNQANLFRTAYNDLSLTKLLLSVGSRISFYLDHHDR